MRIPSAIRFLILVLVWSLTAPVLAASGDVVGRVITQSGEVAALGADGERRALSRRDPVYEGDTLVTGDPGRAQVRFKDQGLTDLRPGTRFEIQEYRAGQASGDEEKSVLTRLVEGGLRTITGAVGRENKKNYRMETPVAAIGIRGTQYQLNYCQGECGGGAPGLYGGVADGAIGVSNQGGSGTFGQDQYFYVASADQGPEGLLAPPPGVLNAFGGVESEEEQEGNGSGESADGEGADGGEEDGDGDRQGLMGAVDDEEGVDRAGSSLFSEGDYEVAEEEGEDLRSVESVGLGFLTLEGGYWTTSLANYGSSTAEVGDNGVLRERTLVDSNGTVIVDFQAHSGADPVETGDASDLGIYWGRWADGDFDLKYEGGTPQGDFHYAYAADMTTDEELEALSGKASYSWDGGTTPTDADGNEYRISQFSMQVDLGAGQIDSAAIKLEGKDLVDNLSSGTFGRVFTFSLYGGDSSAQVTGHFVGQDADGALVVMGYNDQGLQWIDAAGALRRQ